MQAVSFGVALYGTEKAPTSVRLAKLTEDLGYQRLWVGDSHMIWREVYVLLGAIAMATKRLLLGPGVTHPQLRHLTVTASAVATLNELSEGRAFLGFGVGATGPGNVGLKPVSIAQLEEAVMLLKQLMAGEEVELNGKSVRCVFAQRNQIPIYIGTRSARAMQMAARLTDGIIYTGEVALTKTFVDSVRQCAAATGRAPLEVKTIFRAPCSIYDNPSEAREAVKGNVARSALTHFGRLYRRGELQEREDQKAVERLWQEYDTYHHMGPEHSRLVREEWVDQFSIAGTADQVRDRVRKIIETGVDEITIIPCGKSKESLIKRFVREVMERL